jgi:sugar fermentation stimulation protein A
LLEDQDVREAVFLKRPNRFLAEMLLDDEVVEVFVPNPGRMSEMMIEGRRMFIRHNPGPQRRTDFDLIGIHHDGVLVGLDTSLPNRFMKRALIARKLPFFQDYSRVEAEPAVYDGRFDFRLMGGLNTTLIEVKSCTLVEDRIALFPDAPTERGARHLRNLARSLEDGIAQAAAIVFVIQRPDARVFLSNDSTDPVFGKALRASHEAGVDVIPITTKVVDWDLELQKRIPYDPRASVDR